MNPEMTTQHAKSNAREGDGVAVLERVHARMRMQLAIDAGLGDPSRTPGLAEEADALTAAISAMQAQQGAEAVAWQPIESVPKCKVLLYWPPTKPARGAAGNTLSEMMRVGYAGSTPNRPPTHWQPLPAAPATGAPR